MIDCNVVLGDWPFRTIFPRTAQQLTTVMARCGITEAWVSPIAGIFHKDLKSVTSQLVEQTANYSELLPIAAVNPSLPGWQRDLEQIDSLGISGVRLYPSYHQYSLTDDCCLALLEVLPDGAIVQIAVRMVDERRQHPLCQVEAVDLHLLPTVAANQPALSFVVCAANNDEIAKVAAGSAVPDNVWFEISHVESVNGVAKIIELTGHQRLLFGTHMPLFYPNSTLLKLKESELTSLELAAVKTDNARGIWTKASQ